MLINYLKNIGYVVLSILVSIFIITILNYFKILTGNSVKIFELIILFISLFILGLLTGRKANKKGYLEGIKIGSIMVVIILLLNLIVFKNKFTLLNILYYPLLILTSMIGSMVGITKRNI